MTTTPTLPPEFFAISELIALAGTPQRGRLLGWLREARVAHVIGLHGWPLVYRHALLPGPQLPAPGEPANNDGPAFDFGALSHATRRPAAQRG